MTMIQGVAAGFAALSLLTAAPARADSFEDAEKLHKLDIMLMVTGLRCRTTASDFREDYERFTANHLPELNAANRFMKAEMAQQLGARGAEREFSRMGTVMANEYGQGHPWLECHDLRQVTQDLAEAIGEEPLLAAADQLLYSEAGAQLAYARR